MHLAGLLLALLAIPSSIHCQDQMGTGTITVQQTHERIAADTSIVLLDVRTLHEWSGTSGHLKGALLIPLQELEERMKELEHFKEKTIVAYCRSGNRSGTATRVLTANGFKALNMVGGMLKWNEEQLPVVRETRE